MPLQVSGRNAVSHLRAWERWFRLLMALSTSLERLILLRAERRAVGGLSSGGLEALRAGLAARSPPRLRFCPRYGSSQSVRRQYRLGVGRGGCILLGTVVCHC